MVKIAVVTGASGSIGKAIAERLSKECYYVIIGYCTSEDEAAALKLKIGDEGGKADYEYCNLCSYENVREFIDRIIKIFGKIDVLVCCHGLADYSLLIDDDDDNIRGVIDTNLIGTIYVNKYVAKHMISQQNGRIINISSIWGEVGGSGESVYSASKAGIIGFSKALAKELGRSNITVNVVSPGVIRAGMCSNLDEHVVDTLAEQTALGRVGTPEDVAGVVSFLASEDASYITGAVVAVNGGFLG